ncbi:MAG: SIMPL domain-containing protein [Methylovirgula sp.]
MSTRLRLPMPHSLLFIACLALAPSLAKAQTSPADSVPHITVTGRAHLDVVPDVAILSVAVATERPKAADAVAANSRAAQALIDEIKAQGIDAQNIRTVSITLVPVYDQQRDSATHATKQVLRGYRARNSLSIKVHNLGKAGMLARQLIDKGANEFYGINFDYEHKEEAYDKLRDEAMQDALRKAKAYLPALGLKLGRVLEIMPQANVGTPRGTIFAAAMPTAPTEPISIPIEPGTQTLQIEVRVSWEISP